MNCVESGLSSIAIDIAKAPEAEGGDGIELGGRDERSFGDQSFETFGCGAPYVHGSVDGVGASYFVDVAVYGCACNREEQVIMTEMKRFSGKERGMRNKEI